MLIMLNPNGDSWERAKWDLTLLTLLASPLREAKNASGGGDVNNVKSNLALPKEPQIGFIIVNMINVVPARSNFSKIKI